MGDRRRSAPKSVEATAEWQRLAFVVVAAAVNAVASAGAQLGGAPHALKPQLRQHAGRQPGHRCPQVTVKPRCIVAVAPWARQRHGAHVVLARCRRSSLLTLLVSNLLVALAAAASAAATRTRGVVERAPAAQEGREPPDRRLNPFSLVGRTRCRRVVRSRRFCRQKYAIADSATAAVVADGIGLR
jgi:hypothetical protein